VDGGGLEFLYFKVSIFKFGELLDEADFGGSDGAVFFMGQEGRVEVFHNVFADRLWHLSGNNSITIFVNFDLNSPGLVKIWDFLTGSLGWTEWGNEALRTECDELLEGGAGGVGLDVDSLNVAG